MASCIKCGVNICEKNVYTKTQYNVNSKYKKCKHCVKNNKSCFVIYEDPSLYKIASENRLKLQRKFPKYIEENRQRMRLNSLRPEVKERSKKASKNYTQNISNNYVKICLKRKGWIEFSDIPLELIELHRKTLKLKRYVREQKTNHKQC